jgi:hypothetical protein
MSLNKNVSLYGSHLRPRKGSGASSSPSDATPGLCLDSDQDPSSEEETLPENQPPRKLPRLGENTLRSAVDTKETTTTTTTTTNPATSAAEIDQCPSELKTLRYKIMLMNGNTPVEVPPPPAKNSYENLQLFLEKEKNHNNKENWSKLNRSVKNKKVSQFAEAFADANDLTGDERTRLLEILKLNLNKGKLTKNKEVIYDKTKGLIKEMPCLVFNKTTRHFTIKNMDAANKHSATIKKLPMTTKGYTSTSISNTTTSTTGAGGEKIRIAQETKLDSADGGGGGPGTPSGNTSELETANNIPTERI